MEQRYRFQSLLSQGISLLIFERVDVQRPMAQGFNPFLVRASVYCGRRPASAPMHTLVSFQSLLSQGISLLKRRGSTPIFGG